DGHGLAGRRHVRHWRRQRRGPGGPGRGGQKGPEPAHRIPGAVQSLRGRPVAQEKGAGADPQHRGRGPEGGPAAGAPGGTGLRRGRHGPGGA
ncbi:Translation initiation factor 2, partial [Dysosmobacter welbionis]